jgi:hypothetical protein
MNEDEIFDYEGGAYFPTDDDFYKSEGIERPMSVNDRILAAEIERKKKMGLPPPPPPPPITTPPAPLPAPLPTPRPAPTISIGTTYSPPPAPRVSTATQTDAITPPPVAPQPTRTHTTTYIVKDPIFERLYDWGISYIPSYYSYIRRKQLEGEIANILKREMLLNRSTYELQRIIKNLLDSEMGTSSTIKQDKSPYIQQESATKKPARKTSKKSKKPARKTSKKSTAKKSARKTSKKSVKKSKKKKSKKSKK